MVSLQGILSFAAIAATAASRDILSTVSDKDGFKLKPPGHDHDGGHSFQMTEENALPKRILHNADCPRQIVLRYVNGITSGDPSVIDKYVVEDYVQHNPMIPNGREAVRNFLRQLNATPGFETKMGQCVAQGDTVMLHSYFAVPGSAPNVVVDIFKVKDGMLQEHWDVIQEYVPASKTVSGNDMFTEVPYDTLLAQGC